MIDESSNSSCLCSSSESSSMYQADRRPWFRVRMDAPASSPASLRLDRGAAVCEGGVTSSLVFLLLLLRGEGSGDSAGGGLVSSVLPALGRPRRLGDDIPESDSTDVSCAEDVPPSSPVDCSRSSSGVELLRVLLLLVSSVSCLLFLSFFLPGGRPRGLEGLPGDVTSGGLCGGSGLVFFPFLPTPRVT